MASAHQHKKAALEFKAKYFHHHPKNSFWYVGMGLLLTSLFILALVFGEYLLAAVVVAVGVAIFRLADLRPGARDIKLTAKGVYWGDRFFGYHKIKAFWLAEQAGHATLYLERLNLAPVLSFVIPEHSVDSAFQFLSTNLPYHAHKGEPLSDRFSRLLRI